MKKQLSALAFVLGSSIAITSAQAELIGVSMGVGVPGSVYSIDPATGAATPIVTVSASPILPGATFLAGDLYASNVCATPCFSTGTIDLGTGMFTSISNQQGSSNWQSLAADHSANLLYTIDINDNTLKSIAPDGTVTTIGTSVIVTGLAFDDANDTLYGSTGADLYTINTATGVATRVGPHGLVLENVGLAYDEAADVLYLNSRLGSLYTVSTVTGQATLVGANGVLEISGLTWRPDIAQVPEPLTLSLVLIGFGGLACTRRRRPARRGR